MNAPDTAPMNRIAFIIGVFISFVGGLLLTLLPATTWNGWQPATCLSTGCFCEAVRSMEPVRQPANTWSSFAFVIGGVIILASLRAANGSPDYKRLFGVLVGLASVVIGLGSAFYHASLTFIGQFFDIFGMYLLTALMLIYALARLYGWSRSRATGVYVALNIALTILQIAVPDTRRYAFAVVLILAIIFEAVLRWRKPIRIEGRLFGIGLGLFAVAFGTWILDNTRILCEPESLFQGHAIWHILGAVAVVFLNRYYLSEKPTATP